MSLSQSILNKMDAIQWNTLQPSAFADAGYKALAEGFYEYVSDITNNATVSCTATGTITPPVPPSPYAGTVTVDISYGTASTLQTLITNSVKTGSTVAGSGIPLIFSAIATWLATPPSGICSVTGWSATGVGTATGIGTAVFAAMITQGPLCMVKVLQDKPATKEDSWKIIESFLLLGLVGVLAVPVISGTVGTTVFAGTGAGSITYK